MPAFEMHDDRGQGQDRKNGQNGGQIDFFFHERLSRGNSDIKPRITQIARMARKSVLSAPIRVIRVQFSVNVTARTHQASA